MSAQNSPQEVRQTALQDLDRLVENYLDLYRDLHRHPELSLQETRTSGVIVEELQKLGLEPKVIGGTGVVAVIDNGPGPVVLARADIDGLPVTEETGLDYASQEPGLMHACGHDMHVASLLGAVAVLTEHREAWSGAYIALFQPAEETAAGAKAMVDDGLVKAVPAPQVALAQHIAPGPVGQISSRPGSILSAAQSIRITVYGEGTHGSAPDQGVDPVVLAASIVLKLQTIVSRELAPGTFAVVTVGAINAGTKSNIISDRAEMLVNTRVYDLAVQDQINAAINRIVRAECAAAGSPREPEFEFYDDFPLTNNDPDTFDHVMGAFAEYFGEDRVITDMPAHTASEDFSALPDAWGIPYTYWFVGATPAEVLDRVQKSGGELKLPSNHSPFFAPDPEPTLRAGIAAQVVAALSYLGSSDSSTRSWAG